MHDFRNSRGIADFVEFFVNKAGCGTIDKGIKISRIVEAIKTSLLRFFVILAFVVLTIVTFFLGTHDFAVCTVLYLCILGAVFILTRPDPHTTQEEFRLGARIITHAFAFLFDFGRWILAEHIHYADLLKKVETDIEITLISVAARDVEKPTTLRDQCKLDQLRRSARSQYELANRFLKTDSFDNLYARGMARYLEMKRLL